MTRIERLEIFSFEELSEDAQARAILRAQETITEWDWADEWRESLEIAQKILPFEVTNWEISLSSPSYCNTATDADIGELSGVRAWKYLHNNGYVEAISESCPFTGYCGDESFLDPLRAFLAAPRDITLAELFQECADSWARAWVQDMEFQCSDEYVREGLIANEREFLADGTPY